MRDARQGEIWMVDMGMAAKVRPCLLLTNFPADDELALITVLPHTTSVRGNRWELSIPKPFLKEGTFHFQQIQSVSVARLMRKLGVMTNDEWHQVQHKIEMLFSLKHS
jgi:mRNA interferase MazF